MLIFDFPPHDATAGGPPTHKGPSAHGGNHFSGAGADTAAATERLVFDNPVDVLIAHTVAEVRPLLQAVDAAAARGLHAAGFVSYDAAPAFESALVPGRSEDRPPRKIPGNTLPLAWFGLYDTALSSRAPRAGAGVHARADDISAWSATFGGVHDRADQIAATLWQPGIERDAYDAAVARIRGAIADGDVYQVNYTFPLHAALGAPGTEEIDHRALYERIAAGSHGRYSAYLDIGTHRVLSFSPELFVERTGDRLVCRPMKGTAPRGRWPEEDADRARQLGASAKDRAENVMIVDLVRNDLGRVARVGSVQVPALWTIERYPTVWQMTSTIEAEARQGTTLEEIFAALFPCGSVTGAPKIRAMQTIAALEHEPRGVYCGAIGIVSPGRSTLTGPGSARSAIFNVAIRTMTIEVATGTAAFHVGGGVTWDSTAGDEYAEALSKAALLGPAPRFSLLETMRLEDGVIVRVERHLARLTASADYFGIAVDAARVRSVLRQHTAAHAAGVWRMRLLVAQDGAVDVSVLAAPDSSSTPLPVALASSPIDSGDRFLFHKSTRRAVYDMHRAAQPEMFDVLLWNRNGELTEFTIGNLVLQIDGRRWTPPRTSGLLAGTFRAELLDDGTIRERVLTRDDLERAEAIWLINSLRGWVPVTLN